ncbi:MAG: competence/damage-inducible protein A [Chloroflexi bacterium]|nr:competence/damage-inducible protein A [Chloroflexota bacterium]
MKAEIVSTGTELLLGEIIDTNTPDVASRLALLGIDLYWISVVGDNKSRMVEILKRAWSRSDLIITSGGLGPTQGDITRNSIAEMLGEDIFIDPMIEQEVRSFFTRRSIRMPDRNLKQAMAIPSSKPIINPLGTAPGWWVEKEGKIIVTLPGPPRELQRMWDREVTPRLQQKLSGIIFSRVFKTMGVSEASVDEMVTPFLSSSNPTLALYAKPDGIHLRLTVKASSQQEVERIMAPVEEKLRNILGNIIWGIDEDTIESAIGKLLKQKGYSIATMESCTGGLLASTITDVPGSSAYFKGGLITYANEAKVIAGVDQEIINKYGVISKEVALSMAGAVRLKFRTDIGIGITGVAGPDEIEGKVAGTVCIAIDLKGKQKLFVLNLPPRRIEVKQRAAFSALVELRKMLLSA